MERPSAISFQKQQRVACGFLQTGYNDNQKRDHQDERVGAAVARPAASEWISEAAGIQKGGKGKWKPRIF
jgi:hypothetical protein